MILFHNGTLLTQDTSFPRAEALAVDGERIVAVGDWTDVEPLAGAGSREVDLEGRVLVPGLNDAHVHVWKVGQMLTSLLDLRPIQKPRRACRRTTL